MKLPISAILPIYNCKGRLERHLRSVVTWASNVSEIIVVDSGSTDGTLELATEVLFSFGAKILHNPPGLYQSWNAGIAAANSPWCYISTVEDPITPDGLSHLLDVASRHDADVVISPPEMWNNDGSASVKDKMPSNYLADSFLKAGLSDKLLSRSETIANLCGFLPQGLLGSSASNLYRASFLQKHPFPTDFAHCGDTAWGVYVAPYAKVAFTNFSCARFYNQTRFQAEDPIQQLARHQKLAETARKTLTAQATHDMECATMLGWFNAHDATIQILWNWLAQQHEYQLHLKSKYEGGVIQYLFRAFRDEWKKLRN